MASDPPAPRPLRAANLSRVQALFTDVDGTLTTAGRITASTMKAMEQLRSAGVKVVLVSGRPAGFGECWARTLPVEGVIVENGGLYFAAVGKRLRKVYAEGPSERPGNRRRLMRAVRAVLRKVPGSRLSSDSVYTEVDVAIDHHEDVRLHPDDVTRIESLLRGQGLFAVRSSVHVNCWAGKFDKATTARRFIHEEWGKVLTARDSRFAYAGDSFNDAPMFLAFHLSIGVANVAAALPTLDHPPAFITRRPEGGGFEEVARAILVARRSGAQ